MSLKPKYILPAAALIFTSIAAAPPAQHHPFSELFPPNQNLAFGGKDITGLTEIETGVIRANDTGSHDLYFKTVGGANVLWWDDSKGVWNIQRSKLNMSGNKIINLSDPSKAQDAATKSYVDTSDDTISDNQNLKQVLDRGNSAGDNNINLSNENLTYIGNLYSDSSTNFFTGSCGEDSHLTGITSNGQIQCGSETDDNTQLDDEAATSSINAGGYPLEGPVQHIDFQNIEFGNIPNEELHMAWDDSEGLKFYWGGAWRKVTYEGIDTDTDSTDGNAQTKCGSGSVFLDGDGTCHDISSNHASHIHGDLLKGDTLDGGEIDESRLNCGSITGGGGLCDGGDQDTDTDNQGLDSVLNNDRTLNQDLKLNNYELRSSGDANLKGKSSIILTADSDGGSGGPWSCFILYTDGALECDADISAGGTVSGNSVTARSGNIDAQGGALIGQTVQTVGGSGDPNGGDIYDGGDDGEVDVGNSASQDLNVHGSITKNSGSFEIEHPLNDSKVLRHGFSESPRRNVFYQGTARLKNGTAVITLPDYFEALTQSEGRHVQLTPVNGWSPLYVEGKVRDGKFVVKTTEEGDPNQKFHWRVDAERGDEFVMEEDSNTYHSGPNKGDLIVEESKKKAEDG